MNNALKSFLSLLLGLALIIPFANPLSANQGDSVASEDKITQIRTLYWDVWKHADGNWQQTGKPGDSRTESFALEMPEKFKSGYKNIRVEIKNGPVTEEDNNDPSLEAQYKKDWPTYKRNTLERSADIISRSISGNNVS